MSADSQGHPGGSGWRRARPLLAVAALSLFVALLAYGLIVAAPSTTISQSLAEGEAPPAPSFDLEVLDAGGLPQPLEQSVGTAIGDGQLALSELEGTPVMLNFWASWCTPCREEAPTLQRGWERFGPDGVLLLGLNMQDARDDARGFIDEFGFTFPTIRDPSNDVARSYGAAGIPETYFISARGLVVAHMIGVMSEDQLKAGVRAAKRGTVAGAESGGEVWPQR
jgi:cytochrome c biogenesis protein CcmG, thiol:disulfide interchange protein DsbE